MTSYKFALIDDSKFTRQLLKELLLKQGHKVVAELDLNEDAIQRCWELDVDMIFLSMSSSEEEGIRLLRDLIAAGLDAPMVVICSGAQQELIMSAVRLGAKGYLLKPFHAEDVRECIDKHVVARDTRPASWSTDAPAAPEQEEHKEPVYQDWPTRENVEEVPYVEPPVVKPIQDIPFSVELESPQRLVEAIHLDSGIHFTRKELERRALTEMDNPSADSFSQVAVMEREEAEAELVSWEDETLALEQTEVKEQSGHEGLELTTIKEQEEEVMREALHAVEDVKAEEQDFKNTGEIDRGLEKMARMFEQMQTMMAQMPAPVAAAQEGPTSAASTDEVPPAQNDRLVPGILRAHPDQEVQIRKRMTKTHMCNWNEDIDGETKQYLVVCTEGENKLNIEMGSLNKKQTLTFTLEGFFELVGWLEETVGRSAKRK